MTFTSDVDSHITSPYPIQLAIPNNLGVGTDISFRTSASWLYHGWNYIYKFWEICNMTSNFDLDTCARMELLTLNFHEIVKKICIENAYIHIYDQMKLGFVVNQFWKFLDQKL